MLNNVHIHTREECAARGHVPAWTGIWQRKLASYVPPEPSFYPIYYLNSSVRRHRAAQLWAAHRKHPRAPG